MKTTLIILLATLITVSFFQLPADARLSIYAVDECQKRLFQLEKDINDFLQNKKGTNEFESIYDFSMSVSNIVEINYARLDHLHDLLSIVSIITNNNERNEVVKLTTTQILAMRKYLDSDIKSVNLNLAYTKNTYLISLFSHVKEELRKLQDILKD